MSADDQISQLNSENNSIKFQAASPSDNKPHVVIIGCGFGGLAAAKELAKANVKITMIDKSNHHLFQPLLYQVATAGLPAPAISAPIRHILAKQKNVLTLMASVSRIDKKRQVVVLEDGYELAYDYLIVATGSTHSYFGRDEWAKFAPGLKTLEDAFEIRRRVLMAFEYAEREEDPLKRAALLNFTVIGGGPTGVEMAGILIEIARHTLLGEFRRIDPKQARVILLEGSERVLKSYPPELSEKAKQQLIKLGVEVNTDSRVTMIDESGVTYSQDGQDVHLPSRVVIWSAGVAASAIGKTLDSPLDRSGQVIVGADLTIPDRKEIFVIGDLAAATSAGEPVPGVSPAAKQMGRTAAKNILRHLEDKPYEVFVYKDYGSLATIGRRAAIAKVGKFEFSGYFAWLFWLYVHAFFLIGFRNRALVMGEWAWSYFTFKRSARVFAGAVGEKTKEHIDQ